MILTHSCVLNHPSFMVWIALWAHRQQTVVSNNLSLFIHSFLLHNLCAVLGTEGPRLFTVPVCSVVSGYDSKIIDSSNALPKMTQNHKNDHFGGGGVFCDLFPI